MSNKNIRGLARLAAFSLCFVLVALLGNFFYLQTDSYARMTLLEMQKRTDLDLVFVGSSIVRDHFNNDLITRETGRESFSATIPCLSLQGSIAILKELFRTNHPRDVVLVVEPYTFETVREGIEAEDRMMPFLSDPENMLSYYRSLVREDGWYMDRILLYRDFPVQSPYDVYKTLALRLCPEAAFARMKKDPVARYMGRGFVRYETKQSAEKDVRQKLKRQYTGYTYELFDRSKELLLSCRDLCTKNGARFMIMIYPNMTVHNLAEPTFLAYNESLTRFCREQDIPLCNLSLARDTLLPDLDAYYFDIYHLNGEGADLFSASVARYFRLRDEGRDLSPYFYPDSEQYLASIRKIPNVWLERYEGHHKQSWEQTPPLPVPEKGQVLYLANCNHGPRIHPRYRFSLVPPDGPEKPLFENDTGICLLDEASLEGQTLRVEAISPVNTALYELTPAMRDKLWRKL